MTALHSTSQVWQHLEHAINAGHVPDEEKRRAAQLLTRLKSSVELVLIGKPGVGKSRLVNMLTGTALVPDIPDLPPLEVRFAPKPRTLYLLADGSEQARDGLHLDQRPPADTAIIRAELPLAILNRLSLTEICLEGSAADQKTIVDWAKHRADIVLWCSQEFDAREQALWSSASDGLKDHSFLVLTKADQLQMKDQLADRIKQLEPVVSEEFFGMFPLATIQAISANPPEGGRDDGLWATSGGKALTDAVLRLVETGRRADADNALMFLRRNAPGLPDPEGDTAPKPQPVARQGAPVPDPQSEPTIDTRTFRDALEFLQLRADQMLRVMQANGTDKQVFVLDHCLETASKLSEIMMQADATEPPLSDFQDDVMECGDMMVLFHLERTENAAEDAVTLLLQLKKEMATAMSA